MDHAHDIAGKRVVITGAGGIIGGWLAATFRQAGARLCLTDSRGAALQGLDPGENGFIHEADLTDADAIGGLMEAIGARWGAADVLVNNAGVYPSGFLLDIDAAEWDRIFGINLRAPFLLTRGVARQMIASGVRGCVINISSGAARKMRRSVVPYCTSKTALDRLTKGFALELAGVRHPRERAGAGLCHRKRGQRADAGAYRGGHGQHPDGAHDDGRGHRARGAVPGERGERLHHRRQPAGRWGQLPSARSPSFRTRSPRSDFSAHRSTAR